MSKIKGLMRRELKGWKKWEIIWLFVATAVILGVSFYWKDSLTAIVAALTGDMATVLMWSIYLLNAIFMLLKWMKDTKEADC